MSQESMLILEKVIFLKSVEIFSQTSEEALAHVAEALEEINVAAGTPIMRKGEMCTSMYIIISGTVKVHSGTRVLTELSERSVFGELAALDPKPRSADISALTETRLFCLEESVLYDLMDEDIDVVRGIIRVLCRRMRNLLESSE
ncbi:MAG: cyclic nucleotide-binding domain-containing protein [Mariprofundales bacterium]